MTDNIQLLPPEVAVVMAIAAHVNGIYNVSAPEFRGQVFHSIMELYYARIYYENYDRKNCECDCKKEE